MVNVTYAVKLEDLGSRWATELYVSFHVQISLVPSVDEVEG